MASTLLTYNTQTGQILSVYAGSIDAAYARHLAQQHSTVSAEHIAVLTVPHGAFEEGKLYKVDIERKALVEKRSEKG